MNNGRLRPQKPSERERLTQLLLYERQLKKSGINQIAGVDEAGRGPLAGPVVAAACVIRNEHWFEGIDDSKQLTFKKRAYLFSKLTQSSDVDYGIGVVDPETIDRINILEATFLAMQAGLGQLKVKPDFVLIDGGSVKGIDFPFQCIVKGDSKCYSIAAASILAKHYRDEIMLKWHHAYPHYHFDKNKGYGTKEHRHALEVFGPSPIHRRSFVPKKLGVHL